MVSNFSLSIKVTLALMLGFMSCSPREAQVGGFRKIRASDLCSGRRVYARSSEDTFVGALAARCVLNGEAAISFRADVDGVFNVIWRRTAEVQKWYVHDERIDDCLPLFDAQRYAPTAAEVVPSKSLYLCGKGRWCTRSLAGFGFRI
jgi:hypothetical protein